MISDITAIIGGQRRRRQRGKGALAEGRRIWTRGEFVGAGLAMADVAKSGDASGNIFRLCPLLASGMDSRSVRLRIARFNSALPRSRRAGCPAGFVRYRRGFSLTSWSVPHRAGRFPHRAHIP